jgi:hypothetical protein
MRHADVPLHDAIRDRDSRISCYFETASTFSDRTVRQPISNGGLTGYRMGRSGRTIRVDLNEIDGATDAPLECSAASAEAAHVPLTVVASSRGCSGCYEIEWCATYILDVARRDDKPVHFL